MLLAEDSPVCALEVRLMLEAFDLDVTVVANGAEAVSRFQSAPFDLVLMDIDMPVMDGMAAIHAIRALERYRGLRPSRIATLTGRPDAEFRRAAEEAGVYAFLGKPLHPDQIEALLSGLAVKAA